MKSKSSRVEKSQKKLKKRYEYETSVRDSSAVRSERARNLSRWSLGLCNKSTFCEDFSYIYNISIISLTLNSDRSRLRRRYDIFRNLNQYKNLFDSTQLTNTNVDDFIKTNVDEGKTVYVRWIASPRWGWWKKQAPAWYVYSLTLSYSLSLLNQINTHTQINTGTP